MDHTRLGRTGLQVSRLCLGTMTFGFQCDEDTSVAILDRAAEGGIDFIDTADVYPLGGGLTTQGRTEEILGRWLKGKRDRFVVATKCFGRTGPGAVGSGRLVASTSSTAVDASLASATDRLHRPLPAARLRPGHTRSTRRSGRSTTSCARARRATSAARTSSPISWLARIGRSETLGLARFDSVQPRYNLLFRQIEREMLPFCGEDGVGVIPYNPIAGGLLSGKHNRHAPAARARASPSARRPELPGAVLARPGVRHRGEASPTR